VTELGARRVPLTNGNLNIPKMTGGARATWSGEGRKIAKSQPAFGNVRLSAKRLSTIVPVTRELAMNTTYSNDDMFANDLMRRMQLGLDFGALYGKGTEFEPLGVFNNKGVEKINVVSLADPAYADANGVITPLFPNYMMTKALAKNIPQDALGWAFNASVAGFLQNMISATGEFLYRNEMAQGTLWGHPYKISNQIPTDANGKTAIFFGNWSDMIIGDQAGLETTTTMDGTWTDEDGNAHSCFEENLFGTRAIMYDDVAVRHEESFIVATNVKVV
jgi:HK97 family phage major capsid protein